MLLDQVHIEHTEGSLVAALSVKVCERVALAAVPGLEERSALPASPIAAGCDLHVPESPGCLVLSLPLR